MTQIVVLLIFFICCSTGGEIAMTHGMKKVGEPESLRPMAIFRFLARAVRSGWLWVACRFWPLHFIPS